MAVSCEEAAGRQQLLVQEQPKQPRQQKERECLTKPGHPSSGRPSAACPRHAQLAAGAATGVLAVLLLLVGPRFDQLQAVAGSATEVMQNSSAVASLVAVGTPLACAAPGVNCMPSKCCNQQGVKCYAKDVSYASCKDSCDAGKPDFRDPPQYRQPWACTVLGGPGPNAAPAAALPTTSSNSGCYVVSEDGNLLVVRHSYGTLDIPGGLSDPGESPETTAVRETWEETGYRVRAVGLKTITPNGFHIFNCKLNEKVPSGRPDPAEVSQVLWPPLGALPKQGWRFQEELLIFR